MSDTPPPEEHPVFDTHAEVRTSGRRRRSGRRSGCLPVTFVVVVVLALAFLGGRWVEGKVKDVFAGPPDYSGTGHGRVVVQVHQGDSSTDIAHSLVRLDVVKSVGAFTDAARANPDSRGIQVGYYPMKLHMRATAALKVLINPKNMIQATVTVPEGARVRDIVEVIVKKTDLSHHDVVSALSRPGRIGLPARADGNPEGYLFPATYTVAPHESATELLRQMVRKSREVDQSVHLAAGARRLGLSPEQVVTVASILEYEAKRHQDYPKVARAIYNRLHKGMPLQSDATVSYAAGVSKQVWTTAEQRASSSPYNTYKHKGLPPGPIGSPGRTTLEAALHPAKGPWLYWVVVNLRTGETKFATTLAQHNRQVEEFRKYCKTSDAC